MTRTERSSHPRALNKDRSENKSGVNSSLRKGGAGAHNWGSLHDELDHEADLLEEFHEEEQEAEGDDKDSVDASTGNTPSVSAGSAAVEAESESARAVPVNEEAELNKAREFRKGALKGDKIDLAAIARTSAAASTSPRSPGMVMPIAVGSDATTAK